MSRLGLRGRLILGAAFLIIAVNLATAIFLEYVLASWYEARIEAELTGTARVACELMEAVEHDWKPGTLNPLVDRLAIAEGARVTVIAEDGRVLGDSDLSVDDVLRVENHGDRPEFGDALASGKGVAVRHSATLDTDMVYVAVSFEGEGARGVVRAALPMRELESVKRQLRVVVAVVALFAVIVIIAIVVRSTQVVLGELSQLAEHARNTIHDVVEEPDEDARDEIGWLAGSFDQLVQRLEQNVEQLARERDRFEAVLQGMSDAVVALDHSDRVSLLNRAATGLLGADDVPLGEPLSRALPIPELIELVREARETGSATAEIKLPGLPSRIVDARATSQRTSKGLVIVLQEITELRRLERVRSDFVANVSHELRTPVAVILANTETVLDGVLADDPERARVFLEGVQRNATRLSRLIADLLDISRIEAGAIPVKIGRVPVWRSVERVVEALAVTAEARGLALSQDVDSELYALADEDMLVQIVQNLVDNAVAYTPEGGEIRVSSTIQGSRVRIEVADTGPGVPPEHRERIFERFYRVDPGRSREMGGTGLGLAIVKHLVGAMGGQVGMAPNEPTGSIFWVSLPTGDDARPASSPAVAVADPFD